MDGISKEQTLIELGLAPGASLQYYDKDDIKVFKEPRDDKVTLSNCTITLNNKFKNEYYLSRAMYMGVADCVNSLDNASKNGAFSGAVNLTSLLIAETLQYVTSFYPLEDKDLAPLLFQAKKSVSDLKEYMQETRENYRDENTKIQIEKSTQHQIAAAESIARASEITGSTTTFDGNVKLKSYGITRKYDWLSFTDLYTKGKIKGKATTTYENDLENLDNYLAADEAAASAQAEEKQAQADDSAFESVRINCLKAVGSFYSALENVVYEKHTDLLAHADHQYTDGQFWLETAGKCVTDDVDKFDEAARYYEIDPADIWGEVLADKVCRYLEENDYKGKYEGETLKCYLKSNKLQEFKPYPYLSLKLSLSIGQRYVDNFKKAEYSEEAAANLLRLQKAAEECPYFTEESRKDLKEIMKDAKKPGKQQTTWAIADKLPLFIGILGVVVSVIFFALPIIMLKNGASEEQVDAEWSYVWIMLGSLAVGAAALFYRSGMSTLFKSILKGVGLAILEFIAFTIAMLIVMGQRGMFN